MSFRTKAIKPFNDMLRPLHVQLVPGTSPDPAIKRYIPARKTIAAAQKAGLPVGTYIDRTFQEPGVAPSTVRAMLELAEFRDRCGVVCEIGPGSGMYAEEVIAALHPKAYEIYGRARDWLTHLRLLPNVVVRDCDGHSLSQTSEASVDLVHAHKVFVYLEFCTVAGYLAEMARVVRPGGTVAFDIVTENCLDDETVRKWTQLRWMMYRPIPRRWAVQFLQQRGLVLRGSHLAPMPPGVTELLVFRRDLRS